MLGTFVGLVSACVDQPLIPVERPLATGGSANNAGRNGGGVETSSGLGGWSEVGGKSQAGGSNTAGGQTPGCRSLGVPCSSGFNCCSGLSCIDGSCCKNNSKSCVQDSDCCSNECTNGICVESTAARLCIPAGRPDYCGKDEACCSRNCEADHTCGAIEGCKPVGEYCSFDWDCCSNVCAKGLCAFKDSLECRVVGEICGEDGQNPCCSDLACKQGATGVWRCARMRACGDSGDLCAAGSDCCRFGSEPWGHCVTRASATPPLFDQQSRYFGTCRACGDTDQTCTVDMDCCDGLVCKPAPGSLAGRCGPACAPVNGTCSLGVGGSSGGAGAAAMMAPECCSGLVCDSNTLRCVQR